MIERTVRSGFNHVLDAFHIVNQAEISVKFFVNERRENKAIRLTESLYELAESAKIKNLHHETEARWRLVEVAWELGLARHFAPINYDADSNNLVILKDSRRKNITSSRDALNGYQKGVCFYCFSPISTIPGEDNLADVDHFFPHTLKKFRVIQNLDGIWNLVLACGNCNKGVDGKLARLPSLNLLERLARRNEYLIASHHPLRETLMLQTAKTPSARGQLLQKCFSVAEQILIHKWEPIAKGARAF